ncbi:MAG TPA: hypothetical protein VNC79_06400 [Mycobacteriales bacterium]|jgi:hypothetical protein|nr:hypothetical protein [Mycobacteriales bacterium]
MRSYLARWRRRQPVARRERQYTRAVDSVSSWTLQDEAQASARTQFNR